MHHPAAHFHIPVDRGGGKDGHIGSVFEYVLREVADAGCAGVRESSASARSNQWVLCVTLPTYSDSISDKPEDGIQLPPSGILRPSSLSFYARGIFKWFQTLLSSWLRGGGSKDHQLTITCWRVFLLLKLVSHESPHDIYKRKPQMISNIVFWGGGVQRPTYCDLKMCLVIT